MWSQSIVMVLKEGHCAMSGDILGGHNWGHATYWH